MLLNSRCKEFLKNLFSAYGLHERVVTAQNVKTNGGLGTFTVNNTDFTAVNFSANRKSAVVGCANGNLHIT